MLRRHLDQLDIGAKGEGGGGGRRRVRLPYDCAECRCRKGSPACDASDPDDAGRMRSVNERRLGESIEAGAPVAGWFIENCREWREGGFWLGLAPL